MNKSILFVCTGNTCRSPMAEGYINSLHLCVSAKSCGFSGEGLPASENSIAVMHEIGVDISAHKSTMITEALLEESDAVYCMSPSHRTALVGAGMDERKIVVLGGGVPDPYGGNCDIYRACRNSITAVLDDLFPHEKTEIVPFDEKNAVQIARLETICFSEPWSLPVLLDAYKNGTHFFVAQKDGEVLGYCGINCVLDEGYLANLAVFPKERKTGVGHALLCEVMRFAVENHLSFISLEARESNCNAISLYKKFGFTEVGKRTGFYRNPSEDALILTRRLNDENTEH